MEFSGAIII
jgi:hypothetical protein